MNDLKESMFSVFDNDPFQVLMKAFRSLHPHLQFRAQITMELHDENGNDVCGVTSFPDDGSAPDILISGKIPYNAVIETLAHELSHVVAGCEEGHGTEWKKAFSAIHTEYTRKFEKQANRHKGKDGKLHTAEEWEEDNHEV